MRVIEELEQRRPVPELKAAVRAVSSQQCAQCSPHASPALVAMLQLREHLCWVSFLTAHQQYTLWLCELAEPLGPKPVAPPARSSHSERMRYKESVARHAQAMRSRCAQVEAAMRRSVDALVDVLTFEGGWLVPEGSDAGEAGPDLGACVELQVAGALDAGDAAGGTSVDSLRARCLPPVAVMLHQTLYETALWQLRADPENFRASAVLLLQQSMQVANIVADEYRSLYKVFAPAQLALFLSRIRASAAQLLNLEGRLSLPVRASTNWDPLD